MALSPKSPATFVTPKRQIYSSYYLDPKGLDDDGVLCETIEPRFENSREPENAVWKACGSKWTPPVDDENFCPVGNLEKNPVTGVLKLLKKEFPKANCVEFLLRVQTHLSSSNAVLMLIYLRKLQEKGAFQNGLTFEHILALFMSALAMNEDYDLENNEYARILKKKHMLEDSDFMQKFLRRRPVAGEVDFSFYEVSILQFKLADMIDYKLVVSEAEYKAVLEEAANLEAAAATGKK